MRRHVGNALVRARRDLRFALVDRYRALLGSRFVAVTALAAAVVDRTLWLLGPARTRAARQMRGRNPDGRSGGDVRLAAAALGGHDLAVNVYRPAPDGAALALRRGTTVRTLTTIADAGTTALRLSAVLPVDAADGGDWTVVLALGTTSTDIAVAGAPLPGGFADVGGHLVLRAPAARPAVVEHSLEVGVRTAVVHWIGTADERLQLLADDVVVLDVPSAPATDGQRRAEFDVADLVDLVDTSHDGVFAAAVLRPDGTRAPLALSDGPFASDARPADPPPVRVTPIPGRTVEVGYAAGRLEVRVVAATAAVWR